MAEPQIIAELIIRMDAAGNVSVNGPIENLMLCYGLLEVTKDTIRRNAERAQSGIVKAPAGLASALAMRKPKGN